MEDKEVLLSQWQTCVEMANSVSQRRDSMNNLFVTLNIALLAANSFLWDMKTIILSIAGICICVVWTFFIRNFKLLNTAKFLIIGEIEKKLSMQAFNEEWKHLKDNKKYIEGTKLEIAFPVIFIVLYISIIIIMIAPKIIIMIATRCCGIGGN